VSSRPVDNKLNLENFNEETVENKFPDTISFKLVPRNRKAQCVCIKQLFEKKLVILAHKG